MSDLPNFHRTWFQQLRRMRVLVVSVLVVLAALAWGFSTEPLGNMLSTIYEVSPAPAMIGAPYEVRVQLKNEGEQTIQFNEVQGALVATASECAQPGSHIMFSNPLQVSIAPNDTEVATLSFENLHAACEMHADIKLFLKGTMGNNSVGEVRKANLSIQIL